MIRPLLLLLLPSLLCSQPIFEQTNSFLLRTVHEGKIDYQFLKDNPAELDGLIRTMSSYSIANQSEDHKTAFYINAYNLLVIKQVRDHFPIQSPMEVQGFFDQTKFKVAGEFLTLDEIEFKKLIERTQDCRIHFALGCAARSCPFLSDNAFNPRHVQEQLEFRAQLIIDRPNYVEVDKQRQIIVLNKIFDWYRDHFERESGSILKFINEYRFYTVPLEYQVRFQEYDWTLNTY